MKTLNHDNESGNIFYWGCNALNPARLAVIIRLDGAEDYEIRTSETQPGEARAAAFRWILHSEDSPDTNIGAWTITYMVPISFLTEPSGPDNPAAWISLDTLKIVRSMATRTGYNSAVNFVLKAGLADPNTLAAAKQFVDNITISEAQPGGNYGR